MISRPPEGPVFVRDDGMQYLKYVVFVCGDLGGCTTCEVL